MSDMKMKVKVFCFGILLMFLFGNAKIVNANVNRVSVHDPSVFYHEGQYYIFGSHLAQAKSDDLLNWTPLFNQEYDNPSSILGDLTGNLNKPFQWAGYNDADTANSGYSIWAADVIWNADFQWENGEKGAFMYYFSSSSTWRRSVISFAVSKSVEGPYEVVDTLIYSGFTQKDSTDGSTRNTNYKNTNVYELIEDGTIDGFNPKWNWPNGDAYFSDYAPNAIDPNIFFGNDGKMYMTYGSWSGGIFILELNAQTGKPIYPGVDGVN
ncbi:MAG: arabinanase, partial [Enterococcus sp.]|nr:arabinanase [Enterococcus sp.]